MGFIKNAFKFILSPTSSRTTGILVVLVILAAIPLTVLISQKQQELRQRAEGLYCDTSGTANCPAGSTCVNITCYDPTDPTTCGGTCAAPTPTSAPSPTPTPPCTSLTNSTICTARDDCSWNMYDKCDRSTGPSPSPTPPIFNCAQQGGQCIYEDSCPAGRGRSGLPTDCSVNAGICCILTSQIPSPTPTPTPTPSNICAPSDCGGSNICAPGFACLQKPGVSTKSCTCLPEATPTPSLPLCNSAGGSARYGEGAKGIGSYSCSNTNPNTTGGCVKDDNLYCSSDKSCWVCPITTPTPQPSISIPLAQVDFDGNKCVDTNDFTAWKSLFRTSNKTFIDFNLWYIAFSKSYYPCKK